MQLHGLNTTKEGNDRIETWYLMLLYLTLTEYMYGHLQNGQTGHPWPEMGQTTEFT